MKNLKFQDPLPEMVLSGEKNTTWRIDDEREITVNDILSLRTVEGEEFARAKVLWTKMTTFDSLSEEDRRGHESFESEEEMLQTYSDYYDMDVDGDTEVKVIRFEVFDR
ncbi:MAG: ASCH domain-containing protein [Candidatus Nanohaloarchaea archaeon]